MTMNITMRNFLFKIGLGQDIPLRVGGYIPNIYWTGGSSLLLYWSKKREKEIRVT
ncbi:hypothetical protein BJX63DRAFT_386126 [Aspergillus granulosus]|uniref:Uncharacterized protein n=1 Tax=Aspergillus granulosus TaxID=176169 RepID=A0ABR4HNN9_9EURO